MKFWFLPFNWRQLKENRLRPEINRSDYNANNKQHFLYFFPLSHGHGSFLPTLGALRTICFETIESGKLSNQLELKGLVSELCFFGSLKQTPEQLALEATIIQTLHEQFHAPVPSVIAHNTELNCFLMKDSGKSLRSILKQNFDEALLCKAIDQFTTLQIGVAEHVGVFFDLGAPDWRLDKFPKLYQQLLTQKDALIADGLSEKELDELEKLSPIVSSLCKKLSGYSIKPTLVQPDFNDNNTLIDNISQKITIIDLGEISISHPFFSLLNCLYVIKKHHALTDKDVRYLRIKDACLKNFMNFESKKRLLEALEVALLLFPIYGVFAGYRMIFACDQSKFTGPFQRYARPGLLLREFINAHK